MTNNYYFKELFYPNNYYIVLYYIIITISFNYHLLHHFYYIFQLSFIPIFVSSYYITVPYNYVILSYYCVSNFSSINNIYETFSNFLYALYPSVIPGNSYISFRDPKVCMYHDFKIIHTKAKL